MSLKLRELIKQIRACKTAEEERSLVNKETSDIRNLSRDQTDQTKARNLAKCIYIHMLGYQTSFVQMTCVNLLCSQKYTEKRVAYIALCLLLDERSEVLLLTANTIKKDLESSNQFNISIALNAIGEACTADMCRQLSSEVVKLMNNPNPFIKKKAALAATKIIKKCPDLTETFLERLGNYLDDKNHGVLLCGVTLAIQIFKQDLNFVDKYRKYMYGISKYLKNLVSTNYAPEYDINGVTDPFLQVKLIELMKYYGMYNQSASEEMSDLLASIFTNTESNKNTGNSVLYELVKTILAIEANTALINLCSNILGKMISLKDNNFKYIALRTLQIVAKTDLPSVQKHKNTILECMKDNDISIQRRALDLVYLIINTTNIKHIIKECLNFLVVAENEIKVELTSKICQSLETYSPSYKWQIDTLIKMLCLAGNFVSDGTVSSIINLIITANQLHVYSVHKLFFALKNNLTQEGLVKVSLYAFGEFGDLLVSNPAIGSDNETIIVTETDLLNLINEIMNRKYENPSTTVFLLNCLIKLSVRLGDKHIDKIKEMLEKENNSFNSEVQQRASEYLFFLQPRLNELKQKVLEGIPLSKIIKEIEINKEVVVAEFENEYNEIQFNLHKNIIKPTLSVSLNVEENKGNNLLIDLNNIFTSNNYNSNKNEYSSNNNTTNVLLNQKNDPLESIFSSMSLINNQPQIIPEQSVTPIDFPISNSIEPSVNPNTNFNVMNNLYGSNQGVSFDIPKNNQIIENPQTSNMKQIFNNSYITLYVTSNKTDNFTSNLVFKFSNNCSQTISNVKLQFSVPKYMDRNIHSPSGNSLGPLASFGIQQVNVLFNQTVQLTNNQADKPNILKIRIIYSHENKEYTETIQLDDF